MLRDNIDIDSKIIAQNILLDRIKLGDRVIHIDAYGDTSLLDHIVRETQASHRELFVLEDFCENIDLTHPLKKHGIIYINLKSMKESCSIVVNHLNSDFQKILSAMPEGFTLSFNNCISLIQESCYQAYTNIHIQNIYHRIKFIESESGYSYYDS